jgi:hypothetical protein
MLLETISQAEFLHAGRKVGPAWGEESGKRKEEKTP